MPASIYCKAERGEKLILYLKELGEELGRTPDERDLRECKEGPTHRVYVYHFGSWKRALVAAGFPATPIGWYGHRDVRESRPVTLHVA